MTGPIALAAVLAAVLVAVAGALILLRLSKRPRVIVPPAHPRRVQRALDDTGDQVDAIVFQFPDRPNGDHAA